MTWYADLASCNDSGSTSNTFRAIGWLSVGHEFTRGGVEEVAFEKLCELLRNPWNPAYAAGYHRCEFCRFTGGSGSGQYKDFQVSGLSAAMLFVPGCNLIYVCPASITHYIDAHCYQPPSEFLQAVLNCPSMRSTEYFKAILANGGRGIVKASVR